MNTLRYPLFYTGNDIVHSIRKLWLLLILFSFFVVNAGCNESGMPNSDLFPKIISTTPEASAVSVPVNTAISVEFSEVMDSTSIHEETFIVKIGEVNISGTFSYSDLTVVFTPSIPLGYESTYSVTINSAIENLSGTSLEDSYEWSFSTEEGENGKIPQVISTYPAHNAEEVPVNSAIKASFDRPINANTLNTSTFFIYQGSTPISGLVTSANSTATFSPLSVLSKGSTYRAVISADVEDTLGNKLENDFEWSFTTLVDEPDNTALEVQSVSPSHNERNIPVDVVISASFNNTLDGATVNSSSFMVTENGNSVSGSIDLSGLTLSFTPNEDLPHGAEVTAVLTTEIEDEAGNSLPTDYEWSFVTTDDSDNISPEIISTNPSPNATHVDVVSMITATFNEPINESTINSSTIIVTKEGDTVSGSISYSDNTVTFDPNSDLLNNTTYTVTITTGVQDLAENALENDFEWSFITIEEEEITPLQIQSVNPSHDASDVPVDMVISASFDNDLDNSTVNSSTFMVTENGNPVSGNIDVSGSTLSFTPHEDLPYGATVTAVLTTGIEDEAGNSLQADYEWSFVIEDESDNSSPEVVSTSPSANAKDVDVNSVITATFSEPMDKNTINISTIIVTREGNTVYGSVSYSGNRVTFDPYRDFRENKTYKVTITTGVEDVAGNALKSDVVWTFRTEKDDDDDDDDD